MEGACTAPRPSLAWIGRVSRRLSVMDLSFPSHRQQLYHRTGTPPYFPAERERRDKKKGENKSMGSLGTMNGAFSSSSEHFISSASTEMFTPTKIIICLFFNGLFLWPEHRIVLKGVNCDTLAMCAVCSCLGGDRMPPPTPHPPTWGHGRCQSPWQSPNY